MTYVGRFAPSPTGPLHIGSLATAVASFVHAKQAKGQWLVRIEDIDPPREVPGAADTILRSLEALELFWDGAVVYQSSRIEQYRSVAESLLSGGAAFRCSCSRKSLRIPDERPLSTELTAASFELDDLGARYPGHCRKRKTHEPSTAIRVLVENAVVTFDDEIQGTITVDLAQLVGDYVIYRKDGLPAYHLAVVIDDQLQRVTNVVRGVDLLKATGIHLHLSQLIGAAGSIRYAHIPVLTDHHGRKLSKQQGAAGIDTRDPSLLAADVLRVLGLEPPQELVREPPTRLWNWAIENWIPAQSLRGIRAIEAASRIAGSARDPAC